MWNINKDKQSIWSLEVWWKLGENVEISVCCRIAVHRWFVSSSLSLSLSVSLSHPFSLSVSEWICDMCFVWKRESLREQRSPRKRLCRIEPLQTSVKARDCKRILCSSGNAPCTGELLVLPVHAHGDDLLPRITVKRLMQKSKHC